MRIAWVVMIVGAAVLAAGAILLHREVVITGVILAVTGYTWILRLRERPQ